MPGLIFELVTSEVEGKDTTEPPFIPPEHITVTHLYVVYPFTHLEYKEDYDQGDEDCGEDGSAVDDHDEGGEERGQRRHQVLAELRNVHVHRVQILGEPGEDQ